jgi:anti-anti-sigma factor
MGLECHITRIDPGITVVLLSGDLIHFTEPVLKEVHDVIEHGDRRLILDLTCLERIDSSGLEVLYASHCTARGRGAEVRFVGANPHVARLFKMTHLDEVLRFCPTVAAARNDFPPLSKAGGT